ncbi:unnamed protein product [Camellia sinensis]
MCGLGEARPPSINQTPRSQTYLCLSHQFSLSLRLVVFFCQIRFNREMGGEGEAAPCSGETHTRIPSTFDAFADANAEDSGAGTKEYVHVRIQQRNGRKSLTTVQGLKKEFSYNKILKDLKKEFCCNGTVVQDPELGQVIQLQGDQRKNVSTFLVQAGIVKKEQIKIHGF